MVTLTLQYFTPWIPGEKNVLSFNLSAGLPAGVTLTGTPAVTASTYIGTDTNPSAILNGSASLDSTSTIVLVPAAVVNDQNQYLISVICGTTNPDIVLGLAAVLPVNSQSGA